MRCVGVSRNRRRRSCAQEFNILKLQDVEAERQRIRKEYERKEGQVETKKKMCVRDPRQRPRARAPSSLRPRSARRAGQTGGRAQRGFPPSRLLTLGAHARERGECVNAKAPPARAQ